MTSLDHTYTTESEIKRLISVDGWDLRMDDLTNSQEDTFFADVIDDVTLTIDAYISQYYATASLSASKWVRMRATYMAADQIATRRGNPGLYATRVEKILGELETIASGSLFAGGIRVPGIAVKDDFTPVMSNYQIDQRFWISKARVQAYISTGGTGPNQHLAYQYPFYWL